MEEGEEAGMEEEIGHTEEEVEKEGQEEGAEGSREMLLDDPYKNATNVKCLDPAIMQFPRTPWKKKERRNGWVRRYK